MNIYVNPPCKIISSLVHYPISHVLHQISMASSESRLAALVTEGVSRSAEGELAIDETTSTVSLVPNVRVVPGVSAVVEEDEECVGESGNAISCEESTVGYRGGKADDNDSFVGIMSGISAAGGAESEG